MKKTMLIAVAACAVGMSGCGKTASYPAAPSVTASGYSLKAATAKNNQKVDFSIDLPTECAPKAPANVAASVKWTIRDAGVKQVRILVGENLSNARLFSEAGDSGMENTGPWLRPGLSFFLQDDAGQLLGQITLEINRCANKD